MKQLKAQRKSLSESKAILLFFNSEKLQFESFNSKWQKKKKTKKKCNNRKETEAAANEYN